MAYKLIWSPASRDDLHEIVFFISRDSRQRAQTFGYRLMAETARLENFPESGRVVPECSNPSIREIIVRSTALFTVSTTSGSASRLHEYGMQPEAGQSYEE